MKPEIVIPQDELTVERAHDVIFLSFRHSQGKPDAHRRIYEYFYSLHPQYIVDETTKISIVEYSKPIYERYLDSRTNNHRQTPLGILSNLEYWVKTFQNYSTYPRYSREELTPDITELMIGKEFDLFSDEGRFWFPEEPNPNPLKDRWLSHFRYYGLEANPTGLPEFDLMYRDIIDFWKDRDDPFWSRLIGFRTPTDQLEVIARVWEEKHPGQKYFPETISSTS